MKPFGRFASLQEAQLREEGAFFETRERTLAYLRLLDCDRMLYNFRAAFGVDVRGAQPLGGWEAPDGTLRGHSTGHFLSALALAYSATGEAVFQEKMDYMVGELRALQQMAKGAPADFRTVCAPTDAGQEKWSRDVSVWGEGFLSAYSPDQFALLEQFTKYKEIWAPYYTLHKIVAGLLDCYERGGSQTALDTAVGIGEWVHARLSPLTDEHRKQMWSLYIAGEFGGMNESMVKLYTITQDARFLETARMFDNDNIFPGLAEGRDTFATLHANQHIPQILGAIEAYKATEDDYYYRIGRHFFALVTAHHMYAIGGVGRGESFFAPDALAENIESNRNCETCAAYNLLKTARELYAFDPDDATYMDYYERAMINQILASQTPHVTEHRHNGVTYMLPIGPGAEKEYTDDYDSFTCCHGTGMENHVKYQDASFFLRENAIYVNQYLSSSLHCEVADVTVDSAFPEGAATITVDAHVDCVIRLRVPQWAADGFMASTVVPIGSENSTAATPVANARRVANATVRGTATTTGRYVELSCAAQTRTVIAVTLPYQSRWEFTPDRRDGMRCAALLYGPFVMVTEDASCDFLTLPASLPQSLTPCGVASLTDGTRTFIPMYQMHEKPYHTYFLIQD